MNDRGDGVASRGFVFGAALSAGLLGYRAARALNAHLFRAEETSSAPEEEERRRPESRAQEAADAALAARLQREEQAAFARERASRARPRRSRPERSPGLSREVDARETFPEGTPPTPADRPVSTPRPRGARHVYCDKQGAGLLWEMQLETTPYFFFF